MTKFIFPRQLTQMRLTQTDRMQDTAVIENSVRVQDAAGQGIDSWTDGTTIPCGFGFSPFKFRARELGTLNAEESSEILVRARVSLDYQDEIDTDSRLRLTHRYGTALTTAQTYEVQGFNELGPSAMVVNLKRVVL